MKEAYLNTTVGNTTFELVITYEKTSKKVGNGRAYVESIIDQQLEKGQKTGEVNDNGTILSWTVRKEYESKPLS